MSALRAEAIAHLLDLRDRGFASPYLERALALLQVDGENMRGRFRAQSALLDADTRELLEGLERLEANTVAAFLAFDPSLRCTGFAAVAWDAPQTLLEADACRGPKIDRSAPAIVQRRAEARAGEELAAWVGGILDRYLDDPAVRVVGVGVECALGAQDTSAAVSLWRSNQAVADAVRLRGRGLRPLFVSPLEAKFAATGSKRPGHDPTATPPRTERERARRRSESAKRTKALVADGMRRWHGPAAWESTGLRSARLEAAIDAAAVAKRVLTDRELRAVVEAARAAERER